jgi:hypothetical protein
LSRTPCGFSALAGKRKLKTNLSKQPLDRRFIRKPEPQPAFSTVSINVPVAVHSIPELAEEGIHIAAFNCGMQMLERWRRASLIQGGRTLGVRRGYEMPSHVDACIDVEQACKRALASSPRLWWACRAVFLDGVIDSAQVPKTALRLIADKCGAELVRSGVVSIRGGRASTKRYVSQVSVPSLKRLNARAERARAREIRIAVAELRRKRTRDRMRAAARRAVEQIPTRVPDHA